MIHHNSFKDSSFRVALFGVGLETYWEQFSNLKRKLTFYQTEIADRLSKMKVDVLDWGLVDSPSRANQVRELLQENKVEVVFLYVSTYALSSTVLPAIQGVNVPVVVLNLQPVPQLDYDAFNRLGDRHQMTEVWLEHCQSCSIPEISSVFNRTGISFHVVSGYLQDEEAWTEIEEWVAAVRVKWGMRKNRVGLLGNYYGGMLDVYSDLTQQSGVFGSHFEILEMCELVHYRNQVSPEEIQIKVAEFHQKFDVSSECDPDEVIRAATTACALDRLVEVHQLGSLAYYYEGMEGTDHRCVVTSVIAGNTLLTGRNIPVAGEYEVKNVQAMKIMDLLGAGGSFSEFYLTDFKEDVVFLGHDGPAHFAIAEGRVGLVPLPVYHGKPGKGLSIQMTVKKGKVTLLSVIQRREGKLALLVAEGESVPGEILKIGNTNTRYRFSIGAKSFLNQWSSAGPAHHCAIGVGHQGKKLEKLATLLNIEIIRIA